MVSEKTCSRHPLPSGEFFPDIQGLRALAVLAVFAYHSGDFLPGGFLGVDIFFVISGFVIARILTRQSSQGDFSYSRFIVRRFRRLWPALAVVVVTSTVLVSFLLTQSDRQEPSLQSGLAALFGVSNVTIATVSGDYFSPEPEQNILLHTWSLGVEWQFYLVVPLLIPLISYLIVRLRKPTRTISIAVVATLIACSFILSWWPVVFPNSAGNVAAGFYSPLSRGWEFAVGFLVFLLRDKPFKSPFLERVLSPLGLAMVLVAITGAPGYEVAPPLTNLLAVGGTSLLILGRENRSAVPATLRNALSSKPMVYLGDRSYSIYLWHWPVLYLLREFEVGTARGVLLAALLTVLLSEVTFRSVEVKFRKPSSQIREGASNLRAVIGFVMAPVLLVAALIPVGPAYWERLDNSSLRVSDVRGPTGIDDFLANVRRLGVPCENGEILAAAPTWNGFIRCHQSLPFAPIEVVLIGDSHAEHLFPGFAEAFPETNWAYYTQPSFLVSGDLTSPMSRIVREVESSKSIRTVVVSSYYRRTDLNMTSLRSVVSRLSAAGKQVIVLNDIPAFPFQAWECKWGSHLLDRSKLCSKPDDSDSEEQLFVESQLLRAVDGLEGVDLVDTYSFFCDGDECSMLNSDREILYSDNDHLNFWGSLFLAGELGRHRFLR